ncbi:hypothetical protein BDV98DRAFT_622471 [Pterulicium gracile]|uniref:Uncharacterized protein n=1 Tax=Pterulicium gracile TaxID=1884261 RepID=A0A5C3QEV8_9AGAR|nr:hypothetical protein BDV98DRAFT_622471 [Pterula gracilis]
MTDFRSPSGQIDVLFASKSLFCPSLSSKKLCCFSGWVLLSSGDSSRGTSRLQMRRHPKALWWHSTLARIPTVDARKEWCIKEERLGFIFPQWPLEETIAIKVTQELFSHYLAVIPFACFVHRVRKLWAPWSGSVLAVDSDNEEAVEGTEDDEDVLMEDG